MSARKKPFLPSEEFEPSEENIRDIRASMKRWHAHNEFGRSIGRGLTDEEIVERVADEVGAAKSLVRKVTG